VLSILSSLTGYTLAAARTVWDIARFRIFSKEEGSGQSLFFRPWLLGFGDVAKFTGKSSAICFVAYWKGTTHNLNLTLRDIQSFGVYWGTLL